MVAKGEDNEGGMAWQFGFSRCKLLHIEIVDKKENNSAGEKRKKICILKFCLLSTDFHSLPPSPGAHSSSTSRPCKLLDWLGLRCKAGRNDPDTVTRKQLL